MIKIFGEHYYIDIDKMEEYVSLGETTNEEGEPEQAISMIKFEAIKLMIEVIMSTQEQLDDTLGNKASNIPLPFKIAYNTLKKHKILTHI